MANLDELVPATKGSQLKELREKRSLTRLAVAKEIGVSSAAYANWENGTKSPSVENAKKLGTFFHTSPLNFLSYSKAMKHLNDFDDPESIEIRNTVTHSVNTLSDTMSLLAFGHTQDDKFISQFRKLLQDKDLGENEMLKPRINIFFNDLFTFFHATDSAELDLRAQRLIKELTEFSKLLAR